MSHSEKSIKGVDKSDPFDKFCFKKKKRNNLQKQSFFLKRNNLTSHNHWTNKCTITFNQRETKVQSMRNSQPFHTPNVWTFSNEVTLRKKSKFSLEYREESSNPETNSDG